jgi:hypothetical protein
MALFKIKTRRRLRKNCGAALVETVISFLVFFLLLLGLFDLLIFVYRYAAIHYVIASTARRLAVTVPVNVRPPFPSSFQTYYRPWTAAETAENVIQTSNDATAVALAKTDIYNAGRDLLVNIDTSRLVIRSGGRRATFGGGAIASCPNNINLAIPVPASSFGQRGDFLSVCYAFHARLLFGSLPIRLSIRHVTKREG